jgi:hypothetical protein
MDSRCGPMLGRLNPLGTQGLYRTAEHLPTCDLKRLRGRLPGAEPAARLRGTPLRQDTHPFFCERPASGMLLSHEPRPERHSVWQTGQVLCCWAALVASLIFPSDLSWQ